MKDPNKNKINMDVFNALYGYGLNKNDKYKIVSWFKQDYSFEPKVVQSNLLIKDAISLLESIYVEDGYFNLNDMVEFADGTFGFIGCERMYSIVKQID